MMLIVGATGMVGSATVRQLMALGVPVRAVDVRMEFTTALRDGYAAAVTDTVQTVTGRPPRTFDAFAREHAVLFRETV